MERADRSELYFLLLLLAGICILTFYIFKPFLYVLIMALVVAALFEPVHARILSFFRGQKTLSAFTTTILVLCVVVAPLLFLGWQLFQQASSLYLSITENGGGAALVLTAQNALERGATFAPFPITSSFNVEEVIKGASEWVVPRLGSFFADAVRMLGNVLLFLVALYYLFKDGGALKKYLIALSPLEDKYDHVIISKLGLAVTSVLKGSLAVAIVQGFLTSVGFTFFGIPNAILWGTMTAFAAFIPALGTGLVLGPGILYLFFTGSTVAAVGLFIWGATAVGLVDNFLGPKLVGRGMHLHPLLILLSILGGILLFGPIGFLLGPLTLNLFFALLEIHTSIKKSRA